MNKSTKDENSMTNGLSKTDRTAPLPELHLSLKHKWYEMVRDGIKKEEYREIKPFWSRIFVGGKIKIKGKYYRPKDIVICFSNGYAKHRPQSRYYCKSLRVKTGKPEWGAEPDKKYYTLLIGDAIPFLGQ